MLSRDTQSSADFRLGPPSVGTQVRVPETSQPRDPELLSHSPCPPGLPGTPALPARLWGQFPPPRDQVTLSCHPTPKVKTAVSTTCLLWQHPECGPPPPRSAPGLHPGRLGNRQLQPSTPANSYLRSGLSLIVRTLTTLGGGGDRAGGGGGRGACVPFSIPAPCRAPWSGLLGGISPPPSPLIPWTPPISLPEVTREK